jgi:hypothetical protein
MKKQQAVESMQRIVEDKTLSAEEAYDQGMEVVDRFRESRNGLGVQTPLQDLESLEPFVAALVRRKWDAQSEPSRKRLDASFNAFMKRYGNQLKKSPRR